MDPVYQERLAKGLVKNSFKDDGQKAFPPYAKRSVIIFYVAILGVVFYATAISLTVGLIKNPIRTLSVIYGMGEVTLVKR